MCRSVLCNLLMSSASEIQLLAGGGVDLRAQQQLATSGSASLFRIEPHGPQGPTPITHYGDFIGLTGYRSAFARFGFPLLTLQPKQPVAAASWSSADV